MGNTLKLSEIEVGKVYEGVVEGWDSYRVTFTKIGEVLEGYILLETGLKFLRMSWNRKGEGILGSLEYPKLCISQ